jgi:hypothetical protein
LSEPTTHMAQGPAARSAKPNKSEETVSTSEAPAEELGLPGQGLSEPTTHIAKNWLPPP